MKVKAIELRFAKQESNDVTTKNIGECPEVNVMLAY